MKPSTLDDLRAHYRADLKDLYEQRARASDAVMQRPVDTEIDYERQGYELARVRHHFERPIACAERRLIELTLATEEDGIIFVHPIESAHEARRILASV